MAANKFASILHNNTHRMTFLLTYAALEWILIILLLLHAGFSYLISKFAAFFGLKPPCIFCSRIDHIFEPGKPQSSCGDFICEFHVGEVSKLGFCANHRRLADAGDMCEKCADSKPGETDRSAALLSWMKRREEGEKDLRCSCCGVAHESGFYSPYFLIKTESWNVLEFATREKFEKDERFGLEEKEKGKERREEEKDETFLPCHGAVMEVASVDVHSPRADSIADLKRILPIELIDSSTMVTSLAVAVLKVAEETMAAHSNEMQESEEYSYVLVPTEELCDDFSTDFEVVTFEEQIAFEGGKGNDDPNGGISIGSEICGEEQIETAQFDETVSHSTAIGKQSLNALIETDHNYSVTETEPPSEQTSGRVNHLKVCPFVNEIEEERTMPETPTTPNFIDNSFHALHRRFILDRRESGTESLDGSIASDIDNLEPPTIDRLNTALKSERKALIALYGELEEERSASAVAANQTMAMITRLQEEKAAMQMEALQYQRMMEEQSVYDQEALQLLNELMKKREKEKLELKRQLEVYRHKVQVYEEIERRKMAKGSRSGASSSAEESDEISINQNSMEDGEALKNLISFDESLAEFEEERVAILEELLALEEKLFTMDFDQGTFNSKHMKTSQIENGHEINGDSEYASLNGSSDSLDTNGSFEAISFENVDELSISHKKLPISEEVDHVYDRLQALEADIEFLKHCLSSLQKGERGIDLLQEILLHLRDLRATELRSRHVDA